MKRTSASPYCVTFVLALACVLWIYRDTFASIVETWHTNSTFSHGYLIVPLSLWLAWRNRAGLAQVAIRPSWYGALAVLCCVAAWVVGRGVGVLGVEQAAAVALVPALVLAVCGPGVLGVMAMPLGYLVFAVPIGHALVPWLMQATADVATWALQVSFVPVHRSQMYIAIPGGTFEVARACSGLNYVVTGLALGSLYSYLTYRGWRKRLQSMAAFIVIPIVANGLRVYFTILVSYLTDMRYGPGAEHVWFGRAFFILVMLAMFWVGRRWADDVPRLEASTGTPARPPGTDSRWLSVLVTLGVVVAGPPYLHAAVADVERQFDRGSTQAVLPVAVAGWSGPVASPDAWQPLYAGARVVRSARYAHTQGARVDAYVAVYGLGKSGGAEMISYQNRIFEDEHRSLGRNRVRSVPLPGGVPAAVREVLVDDPGGRYRVWYWYMVGDRRLTSPYAVKIREGLAFLTRAAVTERVVTLAVPQGADDERVLADFMIAHASCVLSGFATEACGR